MARSDVSRTASRVCPGGPGEKIGKLAIQSISSRPRRDVSVRAGGPCLKDSACGACRAQPFAAPHREPGSPRADPRTGCAGDAIGTGDGTSAIRAGQKRASPSPPHEEPGHWHHAASHGVPPAVDEREPVRRTPCITGRAVKIYLRQRPISWTWAGMTRFTNAPQPAHVRRPSPPPRCPQGRPERTPIISQGADGMVRSSGRSASARGESWMVALATTTFSAPG